VVLVMLDGSPRRGCHSCGNCTIIWAKLVSDAGSPVMTQCTGLCAAALRFWRATVSSHPMFKNISM
jgi:hypothetical protein